MINFAFKLYILEYVSICVKIYMLDMYIFSVIRVRFSPILVCDPFLYLRSASVVLGSSASEMAM